MKHARKIFVLMLIVAIMIGLMVISVNAESGESIATPYVVVTHCEYCGGNVPGTPVRHTNEQYQVLYDDYDSSHRHYLRGTFDVYKCTDCGHQYIRLIEHLGIHCNRYPHCPGGSFVE